MTELTQARKDSLASMVASSSAHAQRDIQEMLRKGGPEAEYLRELISKTDSGCRFTPNNASINPAQTK